MKFNFSLNEPMADDRATLVESLTTLTKMALNKKAKTNSLAKVYSVNDSLDYNELNSTFKESVLKYSAKEAGLEDKLDIMTRAGLTDALQYNTFERTFFSIQTATLSVLLADTEVEAMTGFMDMWTVGLGDSLTLDVGTKALYDVEDAAYGNNVTRPRKHFKQPVTVVPTPKEASVQFDVVQMLAFNYDFGAEMAKIVVSIRTKQYQDAVTLLYAATPLVGTPFYETTFNITNYTQLGERTGAVNNSSVTAFGTKTAYLTASAGITTGFATQDELNKQGFISDLWGIPSRVFTQSVDTSNANFDFRIPNDKIVVIANGGTAPLQMVQEDYMSVIFEEGSKKNVMTRVYKYTFSYTIALASGNPYGIQEV